jgi:hypothetical protein
MTRYAYDTGAKHSSRVTRTPQEEEESEYEYASYQQRTLEHEASFGPGVASAVADSGEGHIEDAVARPPFEGQEEGHRELVPPSERCGTGTEGERGLALGSSGYREDIRQECRKRAPGYYRNRPRSGRGPGGPIAGCIVGGGVGAAIALGTSAGLATEAGAYGGCVVGGTIVTVVERL